MSGHPKEGQLNLTNGTLSSILLKAIHYKSLKRLKKDLDILAAIIIVHLNHHLFDDVVI